MTPVPDDSGRARGGIRRFRRWLIILLALVGLAQLTRFPRLPDLADRAPSRVIMATSDTRLGQAIEPMLDSHPGLSGVVPLDDGLDAFA